MVDVGFACGGVGVGVGGCALGNVVPNFWLEAFPCVGVSFFGAAAAAADVPSPSSSLSAKGL